MLTDNDLKSYIKSYYLDRKMTYTKLDKHDRAIGVLLKENEELKEEKRKVREYIKNDNNWLIEFNDIYVRKEDLLEILGDKGEI